MFSDKNCTEPSPMVKCAPPCMEGIRCPCTVCCNRSSENRCSNALGCVVKPADVVPLVKLKGVVPPNTPRGSLVDPKIMISLAGRDQPPEFNRSVLLEAASVSVNALPNGNRRPRT